MEKIKSNIDHKDYMRMAMLKHEETFKGQVYELHRLYQMQKVLMQSVGIGQQKQERVLVEKNNIKSFSVDYNHRGGQISNFTTNKLQQSNGTIMDVQRGSPIAKVTNDTREQILDECDIELTLSLGPSTRNPRRGRTNSGHDSLSSSSSGSSQTKKTSSKINNTTIGLVRGGDHQFTWGSSTNFPHGSDLEPGFSNGQPNNSNSPWLFQALSLKST